MADYGVSYNIAVNTGNSVAQLTEMTQALNAFVNDAQAAQSKLQGKQTIGGVFGNMANTLGLLTKNIGTVKEALTSMQKLVDGVGQKQFHVNGKFEIAGLEQIAGREKQFAEAAAVFEKVQSFKRDYNVIAKFKTSQNGKETLNLAEIQTMVEAVQKLQPLKEKMSRTLTATVKITAPEKTVMNSTTTAFMQLGKFKDKTNKELNVTVAFNEKQKGAIEQLKAFMTTLNQSSTLNMKFNIQQAESSLNGLKTLVDTVREASSGIPVTMNGKNAQNVLEKLLAMARELKGIVGSIPVTFVNNTGTGPKPAGGNGAAVPPASVLIPGNPQNAPPRGGQASQYFKKNGELTKRGALMVQNAGNNGNLIANLPDELMPYGYNAWWGKNGRGIVRNIMSGNQYGFPFHTLPQSTWVPSNISGLLNAANILPSLPMIGGMMKNAAPMVPAIAQQSSVINVSERVAAYQRMLGGMITQAMVANTPIMIPQFAESLFGTQYGSWNRPGTPLSQYAHNIGYQNGAYIPGAGWTPTEQYLRQGGIGNTFLRSTVLPGFKLSPTAMEDAAKVAQMAHHEEFIAGYRQAAATAEASSFGHQALASTKAQTAEYEAIMAEVHRQEALVKRINEARARNAALYNAGVRSEGNPVAAFNNMPNGGYYNPNNVNANTRRTMLPWERERLRQQRENAAIASARRYESWWASAQYADGSVGQRINNPAAYRRWVASGLTPIQYRSGTRTGLAQWNEDEYGRAVPLSRADYRRVMSRGGGGGRGKTPVGRTIIPNNIGYRVLGPSMIDGGGIGAISMLKGMGVMYGITGLGSLIGGALRDYVEFENTMKTAENILKSHYKGGDFGGEFRAMSGNIREIGKQTKFTAPEVASAAKFLAMAGLDMDAINAAIRPVANIALVGDTELGLTADLLTNVLTGYKIPNQDITRTADMMTNTFTMSNTTLTEMAEAFKYSAPLLSAGGVEFSHAAGALGILGNAGIKGSQAGTTLRTIMANIINPTKKQQAEWDRLGIKRFDENGNLRELTDIFGDLNSQNLFVDSYYKLFHKTAAQGAVALAAGVERWNEIVRENFLSDGLTNRLAEEKKNTLQGLWAQLTSVFTDDTLDAYAGVQNVIRKMLQDAINWMNTDDAKKQIESVIYSVGDLVDGVKAFSSTLLTMWERFGGFIKLWLKWQMVLSAILIPFRALRSLFNFGMGIAATARDIGNMTAKLGGLTSALFNASNAATKFNVSIGSTGAVAGAKGTPVTVGPRAFLSERTRIFSGKNMPARPNFQDFSHLPIGQQNAAWAAAMGRYEREQMLYNTRFNAINPFVQGIGGMAGGALGAYYGSQLGEDGSQASMWGSVLGGVGGMAAGSWLAGKAVPFLAANPIVLAIGAVVAALGGLGYAFYSASNSAAVFTKAHDEMLRSLETVNGVNITASASELDKRLLIQRDNQRSLNETIADYIKLRREQMGLDGSEKGNEEARKQTEGERNPDLVKQFNDQWNWASWRTMNSNFDLALNGLNTSDSSAYNPDNSLYAVRGGTGNGGVKYPNSYTFLGRHSPFEHGYDSDKNDQWISTARYFSEVGADTKPGGVFYDKYMEYRNALLKTATVQEFDATVARIKEELQNWQIDPNSYNALSPEGLSAWNNYFAVERFRRIVNERLTNQNDAYFQMANSWRNVLAQNENGNVSNEALYAFISRAMGSDLFDTNNPNYSSPFSAGWWKSLGYWDNQWHAQDDKTTPEEVRQTILKEMNELNSFVGGLMDSRVKSLFASVVDSNSWAPAMQQNIVNNTVKALNGQDYQYHIATNMWSPVNGRGKSLSPSAFDKLLERTKHGNPLSVDSQVDDNGNLLADGGNGSGGSTGGSGGFQPSQYASVHATPKQVIVNIENLMSLDSVNVNDPKYADTDLEPIVTAAMNRLLVAMNEASESIESRI